MAASKKKMIIKRLVFILLIFLSGQVEAQSIILELLFGQAENVFKGKVEQIRYSSSNAEGSFFGISVNVEKYYKGNSRYEKAKFGVLKLDIIDLEFDTMIMNYSFQITQDSSYIFFTNKIGSLDTLSSKSGFTKFTESNIEGVPFTTDLERLIEKYDKHTFLSLHNNRNYNPANFVFKIMSTNSDSIFFGKVLHITERQNKGYTIKISTKTGEKSIITKNTNCVCREGKIKIGNEYVFYTNEDGPNQFRLIDESLGIIQASEYDKFKMKNGT